MVHLNHGAHRLHEVLNVIFLKNEPIFSIDQLARSACVRYENRHCAGHRFKHHRGHTLKQRGQNKNMVLQVGDVEVCITYKSMKVDVCKRVAAPHFLKKRTLAREMQFKQCLMAFSIQLLCSLEQNTNPFVVGKTTYKEEFQRCGLFLGDDPELAAKKVMSATTDSVGVINYDIDQQPGISNLLQLLALISGKTLQETVAQYQGQTQYGPLKKDLADRINIFLSDFQTRLASVDQKQLDAKLESSEAQMNSTANETLLRVQKAIGIR